MTDLWCIMRRRRFSLTRTFLSLVVVGLIYHLISYFSEDLDQDPGYKDIIDRNNKDIIFPTNVLNKPRKDHQQKQDKIEPLKEPLEEENTFHKDNLAGDNGDDAETGFDKAETGLDNEATGPIGETGFEEDLQAGNKYGRRIHSTRDILRVSTTKLLVYGYMRGGTTLLGDIFKRDPQAMYWFEPLTGFYDNMYGLHYYLNPWGITHHPNGSLRHIPPYEEKYVAEKLDNLYRCRLTKVPEEVFYRVEDLPEGPLEQLHKCIHIHNGGPFAQKFLDCKKHLSDTCSHTLKFLSNFEQKCLNPYLNIGNPRQTFNLKDQYDVHEMCMKSLKPDLQQCMHLVQTPCDRSSLRVVKALRMTMGGVKGLLERDSDIKMVHYFRDPRAILASRRSLAGLQMDNNITFAAEALCNKMEKDYISYNSLTNEQQKQTLQLKYEDLILEPTDTVHKLYDFIERYLPEGTLIWLKERMNCRGSEDAYSTCRSNARNTAFAWRTKLSSNEIKEINNVCGSLLTLLNYPITL